MEAWEAEARTRELSPAWALSARVFGVAVSLLAIYYAMAGTPIPFTNIQLIPNITLFGLSLTTLHIFSMVFLSASLILTFVHYPPLRRWRRRMEPVDPVLMAAAVAVAAYLLAEFEEIIYRTGTPTPVDLAFGLLAIVLVLEATRRIVGWHLSALVLLALAYAYFGAVLPEAIRHPGFELDRIVAQQYLSLDGMLSLVYAAGSFIILLTIYGAVLEHSGAGRSFGSGVALGATTFLMAELLRIGYLDVLLMTLVPMLLLYLAIFLTVEIHARKLRTREVELAAPRLRALLRRHWPHLASLVTLVLFMALGMSPIPAVIWATVFAIVVSYADREQAITPRKLATVLEDGARGVLAVTATIAAAGIIVSVLLQTGLGLRFSSLIVTIARSDLLLTLVLCALVLCALGLSLPIVVSYLVAVPTVAPALTALGIPAPAAHLFIFYGLFAAALGLQLVNMRLAKA